MQAIFTKPFTAAFPLTTNQYVNALFNYAASVANKDADLEILRAVATNTKLSYEHHTKMDNQKLTTQIDALQKELDEKNEKIAHLESLADKGALEKTNDLMEQNKMKDKQIEEWKELFESSVEKKTKNLQKVVTRLQEENELQENVIKGLRAQFKGEVDKMVEIVTEELNQQVIEKDEEISKLSDLLENGIVEVRHQNQDLITKILQKQYEIEDFKAENFQLQNKVTDLEHQLAKNAGRFTPEQMIEFQEKVGSWETERQAIIDDCNKKLEEAGADKLKEIQDEMKMLERRDDALRYQVHYMDLEIKSLNYTMTDLKKRLASAQNELSRTNTDCHTINNKYNLACDRIDILNRQIDSMRCKSRVSMF